MSSDDIAPGLPDIMTAQQLAAWLGRVPQALANDRYLRTGIPYVRLGRHVRYLKADVIAYLNSTRWGTDPGHDDPTPKGAAKVRPGERSPAAQQKSAKRAAQRAANTAAIEAAKRSAQRAASQAPSQAAKRAGKDPAA